MRFRLRFSLRLILFGFTLASVALGIWTHRAREQQRIVAQIKKGGGKVRYDFQADRVGQRGESIVPKILLDRLGEDFFHEIVEVEIHEAEDLAELPRFRKINLLHINSHTLTDADFVPVARLRNLRGIDIYGDHTDPNTRISDRSLALLTKLPVLELVNVESSQITSKGLATMANAKSARKLYLASPDASIDERASEPLREKFTHVSLRRSVPGGFGKIVADWSGRRPPGNRPPAPTP